MKMNAIRTDPVEFDEEDQLHVPDPDDYADDAPLPEEYPNDPQMGAGDDPEDTRDPSEL